MSLAGMVAIELVLIVLLVWVLNLVRKGRLYVGYGVLFAVSAVSVGVVVAIPPLRAAVTMVAARLFAASALTIVGFSVGAFMFVYVLCQLTIISNRVATVVQDLAVRRARTADTCPSCGQPVAADRQRDT